MAKLILSMDGLVLKEISLTKERMSIGRKPINDIQIDNLAISGEHAAVVTILNDSFLEDLNSTNGTLVNGQPVKKHFLKNGDVVELGKYKLKYLTEQAQSAESGDFEKTVALRSNSAGLAAMIDQVAPLPVAPPIAAPIPSPAAVPAAAASRTARGHWRDPDSQRSECRTRTDAGQNADDARQTQRPGRRHRPSPPWLLHHARRRGAVSLINGKAIDAQAHQLNDHDVIEIAGAKMEFFLKV